jgi:hypothetical protein
MLIDNNLNTYSKEEYAKIFIMKKLGISLKDFRYNYIQQKGGSNNKSR